MGQMRKYEASDEIKKLSEDFFGKTNPNDLPSPDDLLRALQHAKGERVMLSSDTLKRIQSENYKDDPNEDQWCLLCDAPKDVCRLCDAMDYTCNLIVGDK